MHNTNKIRIFNKLSHCYRYPDETGHFYPHIIDGTIVLDNQQIWEYPYEFEFTPCIIQHFSGRKNIGGQEIWVGDIKTFEISRLSLIHTIWLRACLIADAE